MRSSQKRDRRDAQANQFRVKARELGCDETEAAFVDKLRRVARAKPPPKDEPKPAKKEKPGQ